MTSPRFPDWPARLTAFLHEHRTAAFEWGRLDCCLFAAAWVRRCTGDDPADGLAGQYRDADGAFALLAEHGGLYRLLQERLKVRRMPLPLHAKRGDIAAVPGSDHSLRAVGIVLGPKVLVLTPEGFRREPITAADAAWRIG